MVITNAHLEHCLHFTNTDTQLALDGKLLIRFFVLIEKFYMLMLSTIPCLFCIKQLPDSKFA